MNHPHLEGLIRKIRRGFDIAVSPSNKLVIESVLKEWADELEALAALPGGGVDEAKAAFSQLTDDQRLEVMGDYCNSCGCDDPRCQCWNDE